MHIRADFISPFAFVVMTLIASLVGGPSTAAAQQPRRPQQAQAPSGGAERFLKARHDTVLRLLRRPARTPTETQRRNGELTRALSDLLDYDELAKRALATHWETRSERDRRQFVQLLKQLVERSYQHNLRSTLDYSVRYLGESADPGGVIVRTTARSRTNRRAPEVSIDYAMRRVGAGWKVYDVTTDGTSLVRNYRSQFNRIITRESWAELIRRMQSRLTSSEEI